MVRLSVLLAVLPAAVLPLGFAPRLTAADKPNVVVILSDDMGFSDLGCYGGEIRTPNLDALAAGGVRFSQFYNTARCCPTRASLLTGLYPHQAGVGHMTGKAGELPGYRGDLNRTTPTVAEALKPAGYKSYAVGKWHVCNNIKPDGPQHNWPLQRGFDKFYGMLSGAGSFYDPWTLTRGNTQISPFADPEYKPAGTYYFTDAIADHAVRYVGDHAKADPGKPFFLYVAFTAAHWPMHALPDDIAKYKGKYDAGYEPVRKARFENAKKLGLVAADAELAPQAEQWDAVKNKAREAACMEVYAAMIDRMDQGVGKLVAELKRTGQLDNTLVFFLQDNGGCAEVIGRQMNKDRVDGPRPEKPTFPPRALDLLPGAAQPLQTRDGFPVRMGPNVIPGPADTYLAYGRGWANASNTPHREYKHWVHEGGISTPLIAHWPKGIAARGEVRHQPGHLIDVMATALDVSGAAFPAEHGGGKTTPPEGKSLLPAFAGKPLEREALYWEHEGNRAVRVGDWKLVAKEPDGKWELYDVKADRAEQHDQAAKQPEKVTELRAKWEAWAKRALVLPWVWKPAYSVK